jgi:hypothetical protein
MSKNESALIDVRYALRQLREFRDIARALDALERVEEALLEHTCELLGAKEVE